MILYKRLVNGQKSTFLLMILQNVLLKICSLFYSWSSTPTCKNTLACPGNADSGLGPRSGRCPREVNGNPLQYSGLENPMGRGAWQAAIHRVAKLVRHDQATNTLGTSDKQFTPLRSISSSEVSRVWVDHPPR